MTNVSRDRKISDFTAQTSVPSGAYLSYVYNGTNYKIADTDFYASLGVTGTLSQLGDPTQTPVLDKQGSSNRIRNIESGSGVKTSLSPYNGVKVSHNFLNGSGGADLIKSITSAQPIIRNIQAGTGINVTLDDDTDSLIISDSGVATSTKTVIVSSEADLPAASASVITLADDTDYLFVNDVTTSNRFSVPGNTTLRGVSSTLVTITYTGSGVMFTVAATTNLKCQNLAFSCASGALLSGTGGGTSQVQFIECRIVSCDTIGSVGGMFLVRFDRVAFISIITNGLTLSGSNSVLFFDGCYLGITAGTYIDLGTATFNNIFIAQQIVLAAGAGTTFLSGAASSANINAGGEGTVTDCRMGGSITALSGITTNDALWLFSHNDEIADTRTDGLLSMPSNATNTVITLTGTPVLVAGTWTIETAGQMTGTTGGRLTYDGGRDAKLPVVASCSCAPASGGAATIGVQIAVNGSVIANSKRQGTASSGNPTSITVPWQVTLTPGDYIEVFVSNETSTADILVSSATFLVN